MGTIDANLQAVRQRITNAARACGRDPAGIGLVAVSKTFGADAVAAAELRIPTMAAGLSLGDRACLALGQRMGLPVLTTDRVWQSLDVGVEIRVIR